MQEHSRELVSGVANRYVNATAAVIRRGDDYVLELTATFDGAEIRRELTAPTCAELADAAALLVAMAARPSPAVEEAPRTPPTVTSPTAPRSTPSLDKPAARQVPADPKPAGARPSMGQAEQRPAFRLALRPSLFALGGLDFGTLPKVALVVGVGAGVSSGNLSVEALGRTWLTQEKAVNSAGTKGAEFTLWAGAVRGCLSSREQIAKLCAGGELGTLRGHDGFGLDWFKDQSVLWVAGAASGRVGVSSRSGWWIGAELELAVPFRRYTFVLDNLGPLYQPSSASARMFLRIELNFGKRN